MSAECGTRARDDATLYSKAGTDSHALAINPRRDQRSPPHMTGRSGIAKEAEDKVMEIEPDESMHHCDAADYSLPWAPMICHCHHPNPNPRAHMHVPATQTERGA